MWSQYITGENVYSVHNVVTLHLKHLLLVLRPNHQWMIDLMRYWDDDVYNMLAKKSISLDDDWDHEETDALVEDHVIKDGTYAFL